MKEDTKKWILKHHVMVVKEDILSKVDAEHGEHLEEAIKVIAQARPVLLKHFGAGEVPNTENVCSAYKITKLKDPKGLKHAGRYFPDNCLKSLNDENEQVQFTELSLYPKNLVALLDMKKVLANLSDTSLNDMDEPKWKAFIGPATCKALSPNSLARFLPTLRGSSSALPAWMS